VQHAKPTIDVHGLADLTDVQDVMSEFVCDRESLTVGMMQRVHAYDFQAIFDVGHTRQLVSERSKL
jgi:hypothetical protein